MSSAAVWSNGRLIGVIGQHYPREGLGVLTVRPIAQLFGYGAKAELGSWREMLPQLPPTAEDLRLVIPPATAKIQVARARRAAEALAPRAQISRGAGLATLEDFAGSDASP